jgi:hypothetical protein
VFALHVADVRRAGVRLDPEQFLEVDRLALGFQFCGTLVRRFHQRMLRRRHTQRAVASSRPAALARTIGALKSGNTPAMGARLPT